MCVIFHKPAGVVIAEKDLREAHRVNSHGFGFMYYDEEKKRIVAEKRLVSDAQKIVDMAKALESKEVCYHFRIKTHGVISDQACHPFKVTDKKKHGMEIYFMHNGIISGMEAAKDESDTQAFNNNILFPLLKRDPKFIESPACKVLIEKMIGTGNKLCFMYGEGKVKIFNENLGSQYEGMWVSNKNFVPYVYKAPSQGSKTHDWETDMCEYYKNGYRNDKKLLTFESKMMAGNKIKVGDEVFVWHKDKDAFGEIGTVTYLSPLAASIQFKNVHDFEVTIPFSYETAEATNGYPPYECMTWDPNAGSDAQKTVSEIEGNVIVLPTKEEVNALNSSKLIEQAANSRLAAAEAEEKKTSLADAVTEDYLKVEAEEAIVFYGHVRLDAKGGWGACLPNSTAGYDEQSTCILDIYNMPYQERFTFFMSQPKLSYLMFQDMMERLVQDDVDNGDVPIAGETEEERKKRLNEIEEV